MVVGHLEEGNIPPHDISSIVCLAHTFISGYTIYNVRDRSNTRLDIPISISFRFEVNTDRPQAENHLPIIAEFNRWNCYLSEGQHAGSSILRPFHKKLWRWP